MTTSETEINCRLCRRFRGHRDSKFNIDSRYEDKQQLAAGQQLDRRERASDGSPNPSHRQASVYTTRDRAGRTDGALE